MSHLAVHLQIALSGMHLLHECLSRCSLELQAFLPPDACRPVRRCVPSAPNGPTVCARPPTPLGDPTAIEIASSSAQDVVQVTVTLKSAKETGGTSECCCCRVNHC